MKGMNTRVRVRVSFLKTFLKTRVRVRVRVRAMKTRVRVRVTPRAKIGNILIVLVMTLWTLSKPVCPTLLLFPWII